MIARIWRGRSSSTNSAAYLQHFERNVLPGLRGMAGQRGAYLLRRESSSIVEFVTVTLWDSQESIKAFAGNDISKAHVEPAARAVLSDFDEHADHFDVVVSPAS